MRREDGIGARPFRPSDAGQYVELRKLLWPSLSLDHHVKDIARFLNRPDDNAVFVASDSTGNLYGFVELGVRPFAEGCETSPVAYLEGWFVAPAARGKGLGRTLVLAAEDWARGKGFKEMGSDADLANEAGREAHEALGYKEAATLRCFSKNLGR